VRTFGINLISVEFSSAGDFEITFNNMMRKRPDAVMVADDAGLIDTALFGHRLGLSVSTRRPASVIFTRATSSTRWPATTRSVVAVVSPARTGSTICLIVKPWASKIASVRPSRQEASNSSARRRSGLGRLGIDIDVL
jgi:hypothetical protein